MLTSPPGTSKTSQRATMGERRSWRRFIRRALSDKVQVLLHHWSVAGEDFGRRRGHKSGVKLLLWLPVFTGGFMCGREVGRLAEAA
ncbi:hypothetical protein BLA14095_06171 [Burkholderia lata]|nr:hypothetical protein BLA14095_06171 [Burkholderia lata]